MTADRETAADELRRLRRQNKMLGAAARQANERLVQAQAKLERLQTLLRQAQNWLAQDDELYNAIDAELGG